MKHIIIGTVGHIDHGKTALVKALTGFEGDSSKEEIKRGITIDLSFSNMQNSDTNIAFIDVPGHEKLIKNMIAGAFGFDAALLVIDIVEGIMPQTREHLEILNLLAVNNLIVALNKSDLATKEMISQRKSEIEEFVNGFDNLILINTIPTSIYDPLSIEILRKTLFALPEIKSRENGFFRYYIDRSFSIAGAGAIVTGTVLDAKLNIGDKLIVTDLNKEIQIRNIQVHQQDVKVAEASQRAALNLQSGKIKLKRGQLLTHKGYMRGFDTIDVWVEAISSHDIKHNSMIKFFVGSKQVDARILLYDVKEDIEKNMQKSVQSGFAKVKFKEKMYLIFDEPFLLGLSGHILAGGRVLSPIDDPIKKRFKLPLLEALKKKDFKSAFEILISTHKRGFGLISSNQRFGIGHEKAIGIASDIDGTFIDEKALVLYPKQAKDDLFCLIANTYEKNQFALLSSSSIAQRNKWASNALAKEILETMVNNGTLKYENGIYKSANTKIDDLNSMILHKIYDEIESGSISPQAPYNIYDSLDLDHDIAAIALKKLSKSRKIIRLTHNIFISHKILQSLTAQLKEIIRADGYIDISNFKQHYPGLSRKYIIAYLEYLDKQSDIKKDDNKRVMR